VTIGNEFQKATNCKRDPRISKETQNAVAIGNEFQERLTHFKREPTSKDPISRPDFKRDPKQERSDHWPQISRETNEFQMRTKNFKKDPTPRNSILTETQIENTLTIWRQISRESHKF